MTSYVQKPPANDAPRARALRSLREWIREGRLARGETLPSENALAVRLGVGRKTVNRVLQILEQEGAVSSNGRTRVVAATSGARPMSLMAKTVAIFAPELKPHRSHTSGGWSDMLVQGAAEQTRQAGLHALALNPREINAESMSNLIDAQPYGAVVPDVYLGSSVDPDWPDALSQMLGNSRLRLAVYGGWPQLARFDRVSSDYEQGTYELTNWLIARGRRRILPLWDPQSKLYWLPDRTRGYERAMREAGLEPRTPLHVPPVKLEEPISPQAHFEAQARMLAGYLLPHVNGPDAPDAFMAASDGPGYRAAAACRMLGRRPGDDLLIAGYDNYWNDVPDRAWAPDGVSVTVDKRNVEMGQELVRLLIDRAEGRAAAEPEFRLVRPKLVEIA